MDNHVENIGKQTFWILDQKFYSKKGDDLKFVKKEKRKVRIYSIEEISMILKKNGFRILDIFESMTFKKPKDGSKSMVVVSQKK